MCFAAVPIMSREHPERANTRQIQVAVCETTEKQMAIFRRATHRPAAAAVADPAAPASQVSWLEAVAFCEWLTGIERKNHVIGAHQRYRLPTDHEWSCAVGVGHLESPEESPESKSNRIAGRFPWGTAWPPPGGAGNLCGRESRRDFPENYIAGFVDSHRGGSVSDTGGRPNEFGLHDLSGNLWEWCEERFREGTDWRVLRGGSWKTARQQTLLSSHRTHDPESYRSDSVGFRCVLASD